MMKIQHLLMISVPMVPFGGAVTAAVKADRPNIIFILTDDQRWDAVGYASDGKVHTPEIDRLARAGVRFDNAYVTTPISAASRATLLTGMYERTHGFTFQQGPLKEPYMRQAYPVILRQQGYITAYFGKLGVAYRNAAKLFDHAEIYDRNDKEPSVKGYYRFDGQDSLHLTRYTGQRALEFIESYDGSAPFCMSLGFSAPHAHDPAPDQYFWMPVSDSLYEDQEMAPPILSEDYYFQILPQEVREGFNRLRWTWRYDTPEKYQHSIKGYYRMIHDVDTEIGKIRAALEKKGLDKNTVIIFMGDNGYFLGERQLAGKWLMYDNCLRVPLVIYDPRGEHAEVKDMVLNIDIASTILDAAHVSIPATYQGTSLLPYCYGKKHVVERDSFLCEHLWEKKEIPSSEGLRTQRWKYMRYRFIPDSEELYDLKKDPLETKNLAGDPAYGKILKELREACDAQIRYYTSLKLE